MKPYRLINTLELNQFNTNFFNTIDYWNQQYSLHPLTLNVSIPTKEFIKTQTWFVEDNQGQLLACISNDVHQFLNYSLFGEEDSCFNSCSEELFMLLLSQAFNTDFCLLNKINKEVDWLYPGSTCLLVHLYCNASSISMLLNPDWVYQNLPLATKTNPGITPLEDGLAEKSLILSLELSSMSIPIKQLMDLQIGDVIATDHGCSRPMQLAHKRKTFATAELGKTLENKSVIIKEFV